jgi:SAM-dependent methyltransferase
VSSELTIRKTEPSGIKGFLIGIQRRDIEWTDAYLSSTLFSAGYWTRTLLDNAIVSHAHLAHGVLLDVGCGIKPYEKIFAPHVERYIGIEYSPESGFRGNRADFCGDAAALPLNDESVDTILCTEVMEHVPNPEKTIAEFARVLRKNGVLIITAPFFYPVHDTYDFFRYSPEGIAVIMKRHGLTVETIKSLSGGGRTLAAMINMYWYDAGFMWTKWMYPIGLVLRPLLWIACFAINLLGALAELLIPAKGMSFNHLTIGRKK